MTEMQIAGLAIVFAAAMPCYLLANYIENNKYWSLFSGWDPSRITDEDACGRMMCAGLRSFALILGFGGAFIFLTQLGGDTTILVITAISIVQLVYTLRTAKKLYWN